MNYELMVVANVKDSESLAAKVDKALKEFAAVNVKVDRMGKRTLAYPIAKQTEGEYSVYNFDCEGEAVNKIANMLRLEQDAVLRYLITKVKISKKTKVSKVSKATEEPFDKSQDKAGETKIEAKVARVTVKTKVVAKKQSKVVKKNKITRKGKKGSK